MIRDPSDGSVREEITPDANKINDLIRDSVPKGISPDTGIRQPTRSDAQDRLERSREWLKNYHAAKETTHARGSNGEEYSTDGGAGDDQGEAEPRLSGVDRTNDGTSRQG
jgi:hypothetical protein